MGIKVYGLGKKNKLSESSIEKLSPDVKKVIEGAKQRNSKNKAKEIKKNKAEVEKVKTTAKH